MSTEERAPNDGSVVLVPVGPSGSLRNTVGYAVRTAIEGDASAIHFLALVSWRDIGGPTRREREETQSLLDRVSVWATEDVGEAEFHVETAIVGDDTYLFSPDDYASCLETYSEDLDVERIVVDPHYRPGENFALLQPMEVELERRGFEVEEAPVETPVRRPQLLAPGGITQFGTIFVISFVFYQLLGELAILSGDVFDLVTGLITAAIVAGSLQRITLAGPPNVPRLAPKIARLGLYAPYLVYEIVKSNVVITYIILHPDLPIDPRMTRVRAAVWDSTALTTLANSITLTPGTLTVRTEGQDLYVHTLFESARDGLFAGTLERAVRFLFYGRVRAAIATPEERDDCELIESGES